VTVIAWDGTTLAADKRAVGHHVDTITKIARVGEVLVGISGRGDKIREFQHWIADGGQAAAYPKRDNDANYWTALVIRPDGTIERYEESPVPIIVEGGSHAIGSGALAAAAAMLCGKSATEAVSIACQLEEGCGNGTDSLVLVP